MSYPHGVYAVAPCYCCMVVELVSCEVRLGAVVSCLAAPLLLCCPDPSTHTCCCTCTLALNSYLPPMLTTAGLVEDMAQAVRMAFCADV